MTAGLIILGCGYELSLVCGLAWPLNSHCLVSFFFCHFKCRPHISVFSVLCNIHRPSRLGLPPEHTHAQTRLYIRYTHTSPSRSRYRCFGVVYVPVTQLLIVVRLKMKSCFTHSLISPSSLPLLHFVLLPPSPQQLKALEGVWRGQGGWEGWWWWWQQRQWGWGMCVLVLTQLPWLFQLSDSDGVTSRMPVHV